MKVLFITNYPVPYRIQFFNKLNELVELTAVFESKLASDRNAGWLSSINVNYKSIFLNENDDINLKQSVKTVMDLISANSFDYIIIGNYATPIERKLISKFKAKKIPYVFSSDGGFKKNDNFLKKFIKKYYVKGADLYFSSSEKTDEYLECYGAPKNLIHRYHFTSISESDVQKYLISKNEKNNLRKELGMTEEKIVLGVGSFIRRKGWDLLLNSITDTSIGYYVVGGEITEEYKELVERKRLNNVHFISFKQKEEEDKYYKAADVFVLPTREDIWGLVINEAMAFGLPVVSTDSCNAAIAMVHNGENGYVIKNIDSEEGIKNLNEKILEILSNEDAIVNYGKKSLEVVKEFTIEQMAKDYFDILSNAKGAAYDKK